MKWRWIPVGVGFGLISYQQLGHIIRREERKLGVVQPPKEAKEWQVSLYTRMPLRLMSRAWGYVNRIDLPVFLRRPVLGLYSWTFNCDLEEAAEGHDLRSYQNLGEFFRRHLREDARPIDPDHMLTLPSDGKILHFGTIQNNQVEQVKGVTYPLEGFLGPLSWADDSPCSKEPALSVSEYKQRLLRDPENNCLYHCVVYLAPGDYHHFHSPADWVVHRRRHFPGELLSVSPSIASRVRGLFNLNERAVYMGTWEHGFFSMTAVGATNVGSIKTYFDEGLQTNSRAQRAKSATFFDREFSGPGVSLVKGCQVGEFNLGSTIVLIFEAPKEFEFKLVRGQKVKVGEPLGHSRNNSLASTPLATSDSTESIMGSRSRPKFAIGGSESGSVSLKSSS